MKNGRVRFERNEQQKCRRKDKKKKHKSKVTDADLFVWPADFGERLWFLLIFVFVDDSTRTVCDYNISCGRPPCEIQFEINKKLIFYEINTFSALISAIWKCI